MTSSQPIALIPRGAFGLIGLTLKVFFGNFGKMFSILAIVFVPLTALVAFGQFANLGQVLTNDPSTVFAWYVGAGCLGAAALLFGVFYTWMEGALTHNTIERVLGRSPGVRESYRAARPSWGALFGSNIVRQVVLTLFSGFIGLLISVASLFVTNASAFGASIDATVSTTLAIILAIACAPVSIVLTILLLMLSLNWSLRAPTIVGEGIGAFEGLARSSSLVNQHRWRMIGRLLPVALLNGLAFELPAIAVTSLVASQSFQGGAGTAVPVASMAVTGVGVLVAVAAVLSIIVTPLTVIYLALNYLDLRIRKENLANELEKQHVQIGDAQPDGALSVMPTELAVGMFDGVLTPAQRIGAVTRRLRNEPESFDLQTNLGDAYTEVGDYGSAIHAFERARALQPGNTDVLLKLARIHRMRRDDDAARTVLHAYVQLETNHESLDRAFNDPELKQLMPAR
jgi:hypothetical protein